MTYFKPGSWNCICDICGFQFKALELRENWKGQMVCKADFELRNPQDFLRIQRDYQNTPWSRPEGTDTFIIITNVITTESSDSITTEDSNILQTES